MININFYKNGFIVKDHANYSDHGSDIVCAGISAIIMGSISWFKEDIIDYVIDDKIPIIKLVVKENAKSITGLDLVYNQINEVKKSYPKYILITKHHNNL